MPWSFPNWTIATYSTLGYPWKVYKSFSWYRMQAILDAERRVHVTPLFCKLHWVPLCFQLQLKGWLGPLKPYMVWGQATNGSIFFPLHQPSWSNQVCCRPYHLTNSNWQVKEENLVSLCPAQWNIPPPPHGGEIGPTRPSFHKELNHGSVASAGKSEEPAAIRAFPSPFKLIVDRF